MIIQNGRLKTLELVRKELIKTVQYFSLLGRLNAERQLNWQFIGCICGQFISNNGSLSEIGYISVLLYPISKHQMELVKIARDNKEKAKPIAHVVLTKPTIPNTFLTHLLVTPGDPRAAQPAGYQTTL